ncbi:MAG: SGNH/GDSL hydrolase family protein [Prevotella pallens]|nr:SGNH/GDSL hydrolase family protein [Prevotella pallens]
MREPIKILLLLVIALAIVLGYAFVPEEIAFGTFSLKKISLTQLRLSPHNNTTSQTHPTKPKLFRHHQTFLFIGDSMVEGLSRRLGDYAEENGHKLYTVIWYASTTEKWAKSQTIEHFINEYKPSYILLCLGSNELFVNDLDAREAYIKTILTKLGNFPYVWIGPASWNGDTGIIDLIKKHTQQGCFFDSRGLKLKLGPDHYHPTWQAAALWLNKVATFMNSPKATYPVVLNIPRQHHKATHTKVLQPSFNGY